MSLIYAEEVNYFKTSQASSGFVPVYASLDDLIAEHGDVPYTVVRRTTKEPAP